MNLLILSNISENSEELERFKIMLLIKKSLQDLLRKFFKSMHEMLYEIEGSKKKQFEYIIKSLFGAVINSKSTMEMFDRLKSTHKSIDKLIKEKNYTAISKNRDEYINIIKNGMHNFDKLQIYNSWAEAIPEDIYDQVVNYNNDKISSLLTELVGKFVKVQKIQQLLGDQINQVDSVSAVLGIEKVFKHKNEITWILILKNGTIVSGSLDTYIKIWDPVSGKCIKSLDGHTHAVLCIIELENGNLASGSLDQTAIVWDTNTGKIVNMLEGFQNPIIGITELNKETLVINFNEPLLLLWNWNSKSRSNSSTCSFGSSPFTWMTKINSENILGISFIYQPYSWMWRWKDCKIYTIKVR